MFNHGRGDQRLLPSACVRVYGLGMCGSEQYRHVCCREMLSFASKFGCVRPLLPLSACIQHSSHFSFLFALLPPQTGPKGVLSDFRRFEQVQKQEAAQEKQDRQEQIQREAVTCQSAVSEGRLACVRMHECTIHE